MKAITLRNLPKELERRIMKKSKEKKTSINKTVIHLLEESSGTTEVSSKKDVLYHDLDALAGSWSAAEAAMFARELEKQRTVDEELWK